MVEVRKVAAGTVAVFALLFSALTAIPAHAADAGAISGYVTDADGQPVENATVEIATPFNGFPDPTESHIVVATATTNEFGFYEVDGLDSRDSYRVRFSSSEDKFAPEYWKNSPDVLEFEYVKVINGYTKSGIDAALEPGASITGDLKDSAGRNPVTDDVEVWALRLSTNSSWVEGQRYLAHHDAIRHAKVDPDGTYRLAGLPEGTYRLSFSVKSAQQTTFYHGGATEWGLAERLSLKAGQHLAGLTTTLPCGESQAVLCESTVAVKAKPKKKRQVSFSLAVKSDKSAVGGKVAIYRGKKKVKTVRLNEKGKATVKLVRQPRGKHKYSIRYLGSKTAKPAAKKISVRIKK